MNDKSKGMGFMVLVVLIGTFLLARIVAENVLHISEEEHREKIISVVLATSGMSIFAIAYHLDKKSGINAFSRHAWTSGLFESQHIFVYLPMRVVGILFFAISCFLF